MNKLCLQFYTKRFRTSTSCFHSFVSTIFQKKITILSMKRSNVIMERLDVSIIPSMWKKAKLSILITGIVVRPGKKFKGKTCACFWIKWSVSWPSLRFSSISTSVGSSISFLVISMFPSSFFAWDITQMIKNRCYQNDLIHTNR